MIDMNWLDWLLGIDRGGMEAAEATFSLKSAPALWIAILIIIPAVLAASIWIYRREGGAAAPRARFLLGLVRAILLLWIALLLCEPVLYLERARHRRSVVAVLVDQSQSMGIRDRIADPDERVRVARAVGLHEGPGPLSKRTDADLDACSRIDLVNRLFNNKSLRLLDALAERNDVRVYGFDARLAADAKPGQFQARGALTAVGDAVKLALNDLRGQSLAAIVLVSDGRSNSGDDPRQVARMAADRRIPLFTLAPGVPQPLCDVELSRLEAPEVVLARDFVNLQFRVKTVGLENRPLTIDLLDKDAEGERVVDSHTYTVDPKTPEIPLTLRYKPQKPGEVELIIQTNPLPLPGELTGENNRLTHHLKIVDQKLKILFVDGYPRWDYRYLKVALVRDDTVEVQVFLVSADPDFPQEGTKGLPPLLAFPGERQALFQYDVIILGDVRPDDLASPAASRDEVLRNLVDFVNEIGGGICFQAGERYSPASFRDTPLAPLLPVEIEDQPREILTSTEGFRPVLTPEGRDHPILRLESDAAASAKRIEDPKDGLPGFFWFSPVKRAKPGATVLAVHPTFEHERYGKIPLIAIQPYGRGRTMYVGTDDTFRWRFLVGDVYFYRFWRQAISWLRQGRLLGSKRFHVELDRPRCTIGDRVRLAARVFDPYFRPSEEPAQEAHIDTPRGARETVRLTPVAGKPGHYEGTYVPSEPKDPADPARTGLHRVWVGPEDEERERAYAQFLCVAPNREFDDPTIDARTLDFMATTTEGKFFPLHAAGELPKYVRSVRASAAVEAREDDLGDAPLAFLLFALLITIEWVWRKALRMI
jgi:uncharacterized membrane protein